MIEKEFLYVRFVHFRRCKGVWVFVPRVQVGVTIDDLGFDSKVKSTHWWSWMDTLSDYIQSFQRGKSIFYMSPIRWWSRNGKTGLSQKPWRRLPGFSLRWRQRGSLRHMREDLSLHFWLNNFCFCCFSFFFLFCFVFVFYRLLSSTHTYLKHPLPDFSVFY